MSGMVGASEVRSPKGNGGVKVKGQKKGEKAWTSEKSLLLLSIVHIMDKEARGGINWDIVSKKLMRCVSLNRRGHWTYTPTECEERYSSLLKVAERNLKEGLPVYVYREFVIQTVAHGLFSTSHSRVKNLKNKANQLANRIRALELEIKEASEMDDDERMSEDERGSESSEESESESETEFYDPEAFASNPSTLTFYVKLKDCFVVRNETLKTTSSEQATEEYMRRFNTQGTSKAIVNREAESSNSEQTCESDKEVMIVLGENHNQLEEEIPQDRHPMTPGLTGVSTSLSDMVRSAIAGTTEEDAAKVMSASRSPTLSRLLELPPRDRSQPLPPINSIMGNDGVEITADENIAGSSSSMEVVTSGFASTSPLKNVGDEMEIANAYVLESGLIPAENIVDAEELETVRRLAASTEKVEVLGQVPPAETKETTKVSNVEETCVHIMPPSEIKVEQDVVEVKDAETTAPVTAVSEVVPVKEDTTPATPTMVPSVLLFRMEEETKSEVATPVPTSEVKEGSPEKVPLEEQKPAVPQAGPEVDGSPEKRTRAKKPAVDSPGDHVTAPVTRHSAAKSKSDEPPTSRRSLRSRRVPTPTPGADDEVKTPRRTRTSTGDVKEEDVKGEDGVSGGDTEDFKNINNVHEAPVQDTGVEIEEKKDSNVPDSIVVDDGGRKTLSSPTKEKDQPLPENNEDENSNSGIDSSTKKRMTRRSAKIAPLEPKDVSSSLDVGQNKEDQTSKEPKTRHSKIMSRLKPLEESSGVEKEEPADGKRITRARAKTSSSPTRSRTKSTGGKSHGKGDVEAEVSESEGSGPSRATRSRAAAGTPVDPLNTMDSNPNSPAVSVKSVKEEDEKEMAALREAMTEIVERINVHAYASLYFKAASTTKVASKGIKKALTVAIIKENLANGVYKSMSQLERDYRLMFMNLILVNHVEPTDIHKIDDMNVDIVSYANALFEDYRRTKKVTIPAPPSKTGVVVKKESVNNVTPNPEPTPAEPTTVTSTEEVKKAAVKTPVSTPLKQGRKRRNRSDSRTSEEAPETKRRTLRTSTTAVTNATTSWQNTRNKKN